MLKKLLKRIFSRIIIGDEWEQKRWAKEAMKYKSFSDRVAKHNGRIKISDRGSIRVEFSTQKDENAYYAEMVRSIYEKHGDSINRIFTNQ